VLPGGLRVVSESVPGVRSVAFGIWIGVGSRDESPSLAGASHYLEHLLFKGTRRRDALTIAAELDRVGGELNAFTTKEATCFYARVLDGDLPIAVDVVSDMVTSSLIAAGDVDNERGVILDEIAMHDDDPDDVVHNLFAAASWEGRALAKPIAGTAESIRALSRTQINGYYRRRYRPEAMTVAVAGNLDHAQVVRSVRKAFARGGFLEGEATPLPPRMHDRSRRSRAGEVRARRPFEQVSLVLGSSGITRSDPRRHVLGVLNAALGGGSSSRLFQEVREARGLAYSVYSFASSYSDAGVVGVSAGTLPGKADELLAVVRHELAEIAAHGITEEELERGKGQLRGGLVLGLEDTGSRMTRLGESELFQPRLLSVDEVLGRIAAVGVDEVADLAAEVFSRPQTLALVGP
jgi:predicted Zn-dependent peptidase